MTVAAVIVVSDLEAALTDLEGVPALRRVLQAAWAGGALPTVVVAADPDHRLADLLTGEDVRSIPPPSETPLARFAEGFEAALSSVSATTGALLWPLEHAWVDPETVTSLLEAHGDSREDIVRPAYEHRPGYPVVFPTSVRSRLPELAGLSVDQGIDALLGSDVGVRQVELGDPGIVFDLATPRGALPEYQGPPRPAVAREEP